MVRFVQEEDLKATFPYLDNITICVKDQEDHDVNLECFQDAAECKKITYNDEKSVFSTKRLPILGYKLKEKFIPIQSVFDLYENFLSHMTQNP
jgi:hypothetical protein